MATSRYSLILVVALLTAGGATFGVYRLIETTKAQSTIVMKPVVVATRDVAEGEALDRAAVTVNAWPVAAVPPGAFGSIDSVAGRVARVAVFRGEPIIPGRLAPAGTGPGIQVKITPGKRAMAIKIDDVAGISGLIQPNARVDILVTLPDKQGSANQVAKLFMSNMRVLAVGTVVQSGPDNRPINATTATIEVTPDEAEQLAVAMREGPIQLVLRGYGDPDSIKTKGATSSDVLAQLQSAPTVKVPPRAPASRRRPVERESAPVTTMPQSPAPVVSATPRPDSFAVQIYRGDKLSQQKFDTTKKKKPDSP